MNLENISRLSYDEALQRAQTILERLEREKLPIDEVLEQSREVVALITHCREKMKSIDQEVRDILDPLKSEAPSSSAS